MRTTSFTIAAAAAALVLAASPLRFASADVLLGGFNNDLSSPLTNSWEIINGWQTNFVPALSEGSNALQATMPGPWQVGLKLIGGEQLAQMIIDNDTLEFDAAPTSYMSWRQAFAVINGNNETVGWRQTPEINLTTPGQPTHIAIDLANPRGDNSVNWQTLAQAWLDEPNPEVRTYFELLIGVQGAENAPGADADLDNDVDAADFLIWQQNFGLEGGQEQGDFNFDFFVDGADLEVLAGEFGRAPSSVATTIDNVMLVGPSASVSAVPEPVGAMVALIGLIIVGQAARSRRNA
ncbi:MAG: hypothetical protein IT424_05250 [Pirellulales bacterium]|nr:hypothetical protein [Pirellulales bacterium]